MKAIVVTDPAAGPEGMTLGDRPDPTPAINDVVVEVHASGWVPTELEWPSTWTDRAGRDRAPSIPGHELAGVVSSLGYGTTGLSVGQRVFGLADWHRDGTLAEYVAIEARNLAPLPDAVDFVSGASLPISGLTAWQGLFVHGRLDSGQTVLAHGAAGAVGTMVTQLAREAGAHVIGTGRAADREKALEFGAHEFVDLENDTLESVGDVDLVFDVIGGDVQKRSAGLVGIGGTLVSVVGRVEARPSGGRGPRPGRASAPAAGPELTQAPDRGPEARWSGATSSSDARATSGQLTRFFLFARCRCAGPISPPRSSSRRSLRMSSSSFSERRSRSMSQCVRAGFSTFSSGRMPAVLSASAPQRGHSHTAGMSASTDIVTSKSCPCLHR